MPKAKKKQKEEGPKKKTVYTVELSEEELQKVREWCRYRLWEEFEVDYSRFAYKGDGVNLVAYAKPTKAGKLKLVIQGKKTEDWVTYVLEGEITKDPKLGYDEVLNPQWFEPHAGLDESGKGDFFGPLVAATVIADRAAIETWREKGIQDSKRVTSDAAILKLDKIISETKGAVVKRMAHRMPKYNELYGKFGNNVNRLLAWMHAKCAEAALEEMPVEWGMLDQFSKQPLVQNQLKKFADGKTYLANFDLRMETKAESDPVVAAASIAARAEYVRRMAELSKEAGFTLQKGASKKVREQGEELVKKFGPERLGDFAKLHFRTAAQVLGLPVPEKTVWKR